MNRISKCGPKPDATVQKNLAKDKKQNNRKTANVFFCMSLPAVPAGASQSSKAIKKVRNGHFLKPSCRVSDKTLPQSPL